MRLSKSIIIIIIITVGHGGSSAGLYLADPTSPIPSHRASVVVTSTVRVDTFLFQLKSNSSISINCTDQFGNTALHLAAIRGRKEAAVLLLQNGIDTALRNAKGEENMKIPIQHPQHPH